MVLGQAYLMVSGLYAMALALHSSFKVIKGVFAFATGGSLFVCVLTRRGPSQQQLISCTRKNTNSAPEGQRSCLHKPLQLTTFCQTSLCCG